MPPLHPTFLLFRHLTGSLIFSTFDGNIEGSLTYMRDAKNAVCARAGAFDGLMGLYLQESLPREHFLEITLSLQAEFEPAGNYIPIDISWFTGFVGLL